MPRVTEAAARIAGDDLTAREREIALLVTDGLANRAIARFGAAALEGSGSPFTLDIKVVKSDIPNAFALPGGKVFPLTARTGERRN